MVAIGNARLFNELQERNQQITEALRREEAGSEILRQISNTPEELERDAAGRHRRGPTPNRVQCPLCGLSTGGKEIIRGLPPTWRGSPFSARLVIDPL